MPTTHVHRGPVKGGTAWGGSLAYIACPKVSGRRLEGLSLAPVSMFHSSLPL